jgi:hypothetical protein
MADYDPKKFKAYQQRRHKLFIKPRPSRTKGNPALIRALLMPNNIKEYISNTRLDLFGSVEPPFNDIEKMGEWIRQEAKTQPPAEGHAPRFGYRMEKGTTGKQLQEIYKVRPGIYGLEFAILPYPIKDGWTSNAIVSDGTRLRQLWLAVRHIANELDCQEAQATALILADMLPVVPALSARIPQTFSTDKPSKGKIEITIREPVSEAQLLIAYRKLKQALWGDVNHRPASEMDCKLVEFVSKNIDPDNPQWESLMHKWNKENPDLAYDYDSSWRGFRKRYMDAKQKVYPDIHWGEITITNQ